MDEGSVTNTQSNLADWIGRTEQRRDFLSASPADRLTALLDGSANRLENGDPLTHLAHWLYFLSASRPSEIGRDGHLKRGGFLPPVQEAAQRMWAGGRFWFPHELHVGSEATRRSTIASISPKNGESGPLIFLTVRHEISEHGKEPAVVEEHDIVYRSGKSRERAPIEVPSNLRWRRSVPTNAVMLFQYSALTYNGHRIHYDRDYVTNVEHYPGLVVHGPLLATLLLDLVQRNAPTRRLIQFSFRAIAPLFAGEVVSLLGEPTSDGSRVSLYAASTRAGVAMTAEAVLDKAADLGETA